MSSATSRACKPRSPEVGLATERLPRDAIGPGAGLGDFQFTAQALSVAAGGGVRVGLEDGIYLDRARTQLATNPGLVERVHALLDLHGLMGDGARRAPGPAGGPATPVERTLPNYCPTPAAACYRLEFADVGFVVRRVFTVVGPPGGARRGDHALTCRELIVLVAGAAEIQVAEAGGEVGRTFVLDRPGAALDVAPPGWLSYTLRDDLIGDHGARRRAVRTGGSGAMTPPGLLRRSRSTTRPPPCR